MYIYQPPDFFFRFFLFFIYSLNIPTTKAGTCIHNSPEFCAWTKPDTLMYLPHLFCTISFFYMKKERNSEKIRNKVICSGSWTYCFLIDITDSTPLQSSCQYEEEVLKIKQKKSIIGVTKRLLKGLEHNRKCSEHREGCLSSYKVSDLQQQ